MADAAINELLGGLSAAAFLRKYWQKKALLVRQAQELFHAEVRSVLDLRDKGKG